MRQQELFSIVQAPIVSEKSTRVADRHRHFVFRVRSDATKDQVKRAVELAFAVEVDTVHVLNVKAKVKRFRQLKGYRSGWKKAYVKLKPGFDIDLSAA